MFIKIIIILFSIYNNPKYTHDLAKDNISLVYYFSKPFIKKYHFTYDQKKELIQNGQLGLCYAARKYNASKGFKFSTYSSYWIKRYLQLYVNKMNKNNLHLSLNEEIEKSKEYKYLDLGFLSSYEYDIVTSYYVKKQRLGFIANKYNIKIHTLQKHIKISIMKIKKEYNNLDKF